MKNLITLLTLFPSLLFAQNSLWRANMELLNGMTFTTFFIEREQEIQDEILLSGKVGVGYGKPFAFMEERYSLIPITTFNVSIVGFYKPEKQITGNLSYGFGLRHTWVESEEISSSFSSFVLVMRMHPMHMGKPSRITIDFNTSLPISYKGNELGDYMPIPFGVGLSYTFSN